MVFWLYMLGDNAVWQVKILTVAVNKPVYEFNGYFYKFSLLAWSTFINMSGCTSCASGSVCVCSGNPALLASWAKMIIIIITREMQSINRASIRVLDSSFERIAFKTF